MILKSMDEQKITKGNFVLNTKVASYKECLALSQYLPKAPFHKEPFKATLLNTSL